MDEINKNKKDFRKHNEWLEKKSSWDPNRCASCEQLIIQGQHNAVHIHKAKEKITDIYGNELGVEGRARLKAAYHAECYQKLRPDLPGRIECKYCKILSMAQTLPDGRSIKEMCPCSCHDGKSYCSLMLT